MTTLPERQRVAAYGVARRGNEILLTRASRSTGVPGTWWLPGGGLHFGESPEQALVREFMEETGLNAHTGSLLDVVSDVTDLVRESVRLHSVRLVYRVEVGEGTPRTEDHGSTDEVLWVSMEDLEALQLIPWLRPVLDKLLS